MGWTRNHLSAPRGVSKGEAGRTDLAFLARHRPLLVPGKPEVREYRAICVLGDAEIGNFSDEVVITATP